MAILCVSSAVVLQHSKRQNNDVIAYMAAVMFVSLWLAVAGLPVFQQPIASASQQPAAIALAAGAVRIQPPCLRLDCTEREWRAPGSQASPATVYVYRENGQPVRTLLPGAATPGVRPLSAPVAARSGGVKSYAGLDRVDARYGHRLVDTAQTGVDIELGTGYRWQPYVDNGGAATGPVARGRIALHQRVGDRTRLSQQTRIEAGRGSTFVRNSLGVNVLLKRDWNFSSDLELRHDSTVNGGQTIAEGNVQLEYAF